MTGITERNRQKNELASIGFSMKYIDEWQPKTTLYRHKPSYNAYGDISEDVGSAVSGVPGSPDYVLRKSKLGLFPWLPSESCTCQWCADRKRADVAADSISDEAATQQGIGTRRMGPHFKVES